MKAIYLLVRGVCLIFIGLGKLLAFLFYGIYYKLTNKMLGTRYWEDRVMCATAIAIYSGAMMIWFPLWMSVLKHDFGDMFLTIATSIIWFPAFIGMNKASEQCRKKCRVPTNLLEWGYKKYIPAAKVRRISSAESDSDYIQGMKELDDHLNVEKNWENRLKNAPALIKHKHKHR